MRADAAASAVQRLFIALPCPLMPRIQTALDELRSAQRAANSGLRVVHDDTLHITLKFLGATAAEALPRIQAALDAALREHSAFTLELAGAGCFHSALWLGVKSHPALSALAQSCNAAMETLGFAPDDKSYRPHVTLARLKRNPDFDVKAWMQRHRDDAWGDVVADAVHLYRSETLPGGARYTIAHSMRLR